MTIKQTVEDYLETEPKFRERRNKDRGLVNLLARRYSALRVMLDERMIDKDTVVAIVQDYASMDRAWRQKLEHDPSLRGKDYADKVVLEQEKQIELGYVPGHDADVKRLKQL